MNVERFRRVPGRLTLILALLATAASTALAQQADDAPAAESPWGWLAMPKITMPKIEMPKMPADPFAPIKSSARKVSDGGKKAWEGTKEIFTLGGSKGDQPAARVASAGEAPSMWQRMFGAKPKEPEGPQTITEWMSQKRVE